MRPIIARFTKAPDGQPLVEIINFMALGAEFKAGDAQHYARMLNLIAIDARLGVSGQRTYPQEAA